MSIINGKEVEVCIINDLVEERGHTLEQAKKWAKENHASIVSKMWRAYTSELERSPYYLKEKEDD